MYVMIKFKPIPSRSLASNLLLIKVWMVLFISRPISSHGPSQMIADLDKPHNKTSFLHRKVLSGICKSN